MEPIECSETSAIITQTPGRYPKENTLPGRLFVNVVFAWYVYTHCVSSLAVGRVCSIIVYTMHGAKKTWKAQYITLLFSSFSTFCKVHLEQKMSKQEEINLAAQVSHNRCPQNTNLNFWVTTLLNSYQIRTKFDLCIIRSCTYSKLRSEAVFLPYKANACFVDLECTKRFF